MNKYFPEIKNHFGFGCMRFPMIDENTIDKEQVCKMVDKFIESGFNYFDTAHGYHNGMSETTLKESGLKPIFRLSPPRKGYESTRTPYSKGGSLGYRSENINELLEKMI